MASRHDQRLPSSVLILGLISFSVFLGALDLTVAATIMRQVIYDLEIPFPAGMNQAVWIVTGYLLAYTLTMPLMGRLSDLYGRRRVFLSCLLLFAAGSIVVGTANSLLQMIGGRVVQALGAGALVPVSMAVIGDIFPEERRAFALGVLGAVDTAGWVVGPLYGALMVTRFEWRWIFFINVPLGLLAAALVFIALRERNRPVASMKTMQMDYAGAVLFSIALASLNFALTGNSTAESSFAAASAQSGGGLSPYAPVWLAIFFASGLLFWWCESHSSSPLIDPALFRHVTFSAACIVNLLIGGALIAAVVDVPLFVNTVMLLARGFTPAQSDLQSGTILAILTTAMVIAAIVGGWLTEHLGYRIPVLIGLIFAFGGFLLLSRWGATLDDFTQARDLIVCGIGLGIVIAPIATAVINTVAEHQRGMASALVLILRLVGMTIALSTLTTWGVSRFDELSRAVPLTAITTEFILHISAQVMDEIFALAAVVCALALAPALFLRRTAMPVTRTVHSWW
jgi:EmrB/QacA subfamily drug resistance transporter